MSSVSAETVYVGIGSNMGNKAANCLEGIRQIVNDGRARLIAISSLYVTSPVSTVTQDDFVNCAATIAWRDSPFVLLRRLNEIEAEMGRVRGKIRDGPRVIALDILLFGSSILFDPLLIIPHPQLHRRKFALLPCLEINPDLIHPAFNKPLAALFTEIGAEQQIRLLRRIDPQEIVKCGLETPSKKGGIVKE